MAIAYPTGMTAQAGFNLTGVPALVLFALVAAYFVGGRRLRAARSGTAPSGSRGRSRRPKLWSGQRGDAPEDAPAPRKLQAVGRVLPGPIPGGLHHQYVRV